MVAASSIAMWQLLLRWKKVGQMMPCLEAGAQ